MDKLPVEVVLQQLITNREKCPYCKKENLDISPSKLGTDFWHLICQDCHEEWEEEVELIRVLRGPAYGRNHEEASIDDGHRAYRMYWTTVDGSQTSWEEDKEHTVYVFGAPTDDAAMDIGFEALKKLHRELSFDEEPGEPFWTCTSDPHELSEDEFFKNTISHWGRRYPIAAITGDFRIVAKEKEA